MASRYTPEQLSILQLAEHILGRELPELKEHSRRQTPRSTHTPASTLSVRQQEASSPPFQETPPPHPLDWHFESQRNDGSSYDSTLWNMDAGLIGAFETNDAVPATLQSNATLDKNLPSIRSDHAGIEELDVSRPFRDYLTGMDLTLNGAYHPPQIGQMNSFNLALGSLQQPQD
jgi:hypothetical protein